MLALVEITAWHWVGFILGVIIFLALDLGVFHRTAHVVRFREAMFWTILWASLALLFAGALVLWRNHEEAVQFFTGYFIELSLSMDNVFVIALIFTYFRVPSEHQHRVLFWGILGALIMRGLMILAGVALVTRFDWVLYLLGLVLLYTGLKMLFVRSDKIEPDKNPVARLARQFLPLSPDFEGQKLTVVRNGQRLLTPLFLVLLMVETADLIFAVDSIPAIFGVTRKPFIVFTSNVFAILGLRSLYFVLAGAIGYFRCLKFGLSIVLLFIGVKMLIDPHDRRPRWFQYDIPDSSSLAVVVSIIAAAILASLIAARRERDRNK
ncbi:MAG TPA: TerC/Alx family metal homeostasis membrane protein [Verrucomicrobiae bacterium]|nr:TerC/Alx family metal homeostasis membrane protein [Verrucomicrobiae bacterium]